jgi:hypothetical protein
MKKIIKKLTNYLSKLSVEKEDVVDVFITDLLSVEVCPDKKYPLNIKFKYKPDEGIDQKGKGPGVYVISYEGKIVYIGKHIAKAKGVVEERCLKHLQTFTSRSLDLNLGTSAKKKWHQLMADDTEDGGFYKVINDAAIIGNHFSKRAGVKSSKNRIRFSERHWCDFRITEGVEDILNSFEIWWFKFGNFEDDEDERPKGIVKHVEAKLICRYLPECNNEFYKVIKLYESHCKEATFKSLTKEINELINEVEPNEEISVTEDKFIVTYK